MKYKVLLCGKSKVIIDDFFIHLEQEFEAQTTSLRCADMMSHLKYFTPDVVLFCMYKETEDVIDAITSFKSKFEQYNTALVIIGNEEECRAFQKATHDMANLVLTKPIMARKIGEEISKFADQWKLEHETVNAEEPEEKAASAEQPKEKAVSTERALPDVAQKDTGVGDASPAKKHVLVVDDDPLMLKLIKEQLKDNYTVATAISGSIALKFLENKKTDMIILDYEMPGENGADVLKKIRDNEVTSNLPVVFLTGITDREKIKKVIGLKPQGYLIKPIEREQLLQIISKTIG